MASRQIPQATIVPQSPQVGLATSSGQHLLLPHRSPQSRKEQTILVEITSRDRNYLNLIPSNPIKYTFARPLKDVRMIELIAGTIPANPYNIIHGANKFSFYEYGQAEQVLTISPGVYTSTTLVAALNTLFSSLTTVNTYTWSQNSSGQMVLTRNTGTTVFYLLFLSGTYSDELDRSCGHFVQQNTPALQMGFDLSDYKDISGVLTSPFPIDLYSSMNRLYLYINIQNNLDFGIIERGSGRRKPFAVIYLDDQTNGYKYLNKDTLTPVSFSLPQPLGRLVDLDIEFRDEWYRLVNFNGKDFTLLLNFTVLE
jgi:hypothetical protein